MHQKIVTGFVCGALLGGCGFVPARPLLLPPPHQPLEARVVAWRQHAAMPHATFSGWRLRVGDDPRLATVRDARPLLVNSPRAALQFEERDSLQTIGWSLAGVGIGLELASLVAITEAAERSGGDEGVLERSLPLTLTLLTSGLVVGLVGAFMLQAAEYRVPRAAEAYNRWLWQQLGLPYAPTMPLE